MLAGLTYPGGISGNGDVADDFLSVRGTGGIQPIPVCCSCAWRYAHSLDDARARVDMAMPISTLTRTVRRLLPMYHVLICIYTGLLI